MIIINDIKVQILYRYDYYLINDFCFTTSKKKNFTFEIIVRHSPRTEHPLDIGLRIHELFKTHRHIFHHRFRC